MINGMIVFPHIRLFLGGLTMGYEKISITIPDDIYREVKELSEQRAVKLSHLVTKALAEEIRKSKEEAFITRINKIFEDTEVADEQQLMAEDIAESTDVEELPW